MQSLQETARWFVNEYGDIGLFIGLFLEFLGLPFPGEISQVFAGFLISQGYLQLEVTLAVCIAASTLGSMAAHVIGCRYGNTILYKWGPYFGLKSKYVEKAEKWFKKNRITMILLSRYVIGVRHVTPYFTGVIRMKFWEALGWNLLGSVIWCVPLILLGFFAGEAYETIFQQFHKYLKYILLGSAIFCAICYGLYIIIGRLKDASAEVDKDDRW